MTARKSVSSRKPPLEPSLAQEEHRSFVVTRQKSRGWTSQHGRLWIYHIVTAMISRRAAMTLSEIVMAAREKRDDKQSEMDSVKQDNATLVGSCSSPSYVSLVVEALKRSKTHASEFAMKY
jgi:hypothetical protein